MGAELRRSLRVRSDTPWLGRDKACKLAHPSLENDLGSALNNPAVWFFWENRAGRKEEFRGWVKHMLFYSPLVFEWKSKIFQERLAGSGGLAAP